MKLKYLPVATVFAATTVLLFPSPASTQGIPDRAGVDAISATTTPDRDRSRPYRFVTTGKITPPPRFCAAGGKPGQGGQNCVPILCPPGLNRGEQYCFAPPASTVCSGIVTIRFQKRSNTISSRNRAVQPDCTFRSEVSFRTRNRGRRGKLRVRVRFQGNSLLMPISSEIQSVRAG